MPGYRAGSRQHRRACPGEPTPEAVWAEQAESLVSEARAAGFEPYGLTKKRPRGAAVEQWRAAFLDAHRY